MIKVGITGGIGSGKSLICQIFSRLNVPVYIADDASKYILENDPEIRTVLISLTNEKIYNGSTLNRTLLADYIFNNKSLLAKVNQIIHPKVADHFNNWCIQHNDNPYIIQESAILIESKAYLSFDKIINVTSPYHLKIKRIISRKNMTLKRIKAIMSNQISDNKRNSYSHFIIVNDEVKPLIPQVLQLHQILNQ